MHLDGDVRAQAEAGACKQWSAAEWLNSSKVVEEDGSSMMQRHSRDSGSDGLNSRLKGTVGPSKERAS